MRAAPHALVSHPDDLPPRQREILALIAAGLDDRAIAAALGIAIQTVRNHATRLYRHLPLSAAGSPRTAAAVWYLGFGASPIPTGQEREGV